MSGVLEWFVTPLPPVIAHAAYAALGYLVGRERGRRRRHGASSEA